MRSAWRWPFFVSSRARSSLPFASSASACRQRMSCMSCLLFGAGIHLDPPAPARGERDASEYERDPRDVERLDALAEEEPCQQASEHGHEVHEDAGDIRPHFADRAI